MRILTRYLLRSHVGPFLFALSMLTSLLLINVIARRFEELAGKGLPAGVIVEVFALSIPHIVALTLPMAVLIAVLYTFSQVTAENEVTALKASGVNLTRLLAPVILAGAVLAAGMLWFNDRVLPETNHKLKNLLIDISRKSPTLQLREQVINEIQTGDFRTRYYLQAGQIDPATNRLKDVVIYDLSVPGRERTVYADSGRMAFNPDQTDLFLNLYDGEVHEVTAAEPQTFQRLFFDNQVIRMRGVGNQLERSDAVGYRGEREMSLAMLQAEITQRRRDLAQVEADAAELQTLPDDGLTREGRNVAMQREVLENRRAMLTANVNSYKVEYHKKFSIAFACVVFVLIGAPLAVRFPRGGVGMVIAASVAIFTIYWIGLRSGEELGDKGLMPPFLAMWITNIIGLVIGAWAVLRVGREVSTSRGGGWDDLRESLRHFFRHPIRVLMPGRSRA